MEEDVRDEPDRIAVAAGLVDERLNAAVDGLGRGVGAAMGKEGQQILNVFAADACHAADRRHCGAQGAGEPGPQVGMAGRKPQWVAPCAIYGPST